MSGKQGLQTSDCYFAITPHDTNLLTQECRGLLISTGGTLAVTRPDGTLVETTVPAGFFPGRVIRVRSTNTAALGITGFV